MLCHAGWKRAAFGAVCLTASLAVLAVDQARVPARWDDSEDLESIAVRPPAGMSFSPRVSFNLSGLGVAIASLEPWRPDASLEEIAGAWKRVGFRNIERLDRELAGSNLRNSDRLVRLLQKAMYAAYEGQTDLACEALARARSIVDTDGELAAPWRYTVIYQQGVAALRRGEDENCVRCRGESACILPIARSAVHTNPVGSRQAIAFFTEYLQQFPTDLEARWLLNLAHMTLGEYPHRVQPAFLVRLDHFNKSEFDIGRFRDVGALVGVSRLNQAGGAVMDDFNNDGLFDMMVTSWDATQSMAFYRSQGDGTFEDRTAQAQLQKQLGGLNCVQGDYNNDGHLDLFIARGAWMPLNLAMPPSLLKNNGDGTFTDITAEAGLRVPVNSNSAAFADFDNDGFLDLFVCSETARSRLYRNQRDGTFADVTDDAGIWAMKEMCKGVTWTDFNNDNYPDLFLSNLSAPARLYRNNRNGTFTDISSTAGVRLAQGGFSCWTWDYDNDGLLDILATCYDRSTEDIVRGLIGQPHYRRSVNRLFRNVDGQRFKDVAAEAGLDGVFATMGSNFADFDNDGYLDMYLATGEPSLATLVPNRMFKNVGGRRFSEITASSGTGHLQKGHGVACGDWDRDGDVDLFVQTGGAINGDRYHNLLFQNPGQSNRSVSLKLIGRKTNRSAIGARIKIVTAGEPSQTIYRHVSSGSSFGANPLEQTIGMGKADAIALLEVHWPTSNTRQIFRNIAVDQRIEIEEFATSYKRLPTRPLQVPADLTAGATP